MKNLVRTTLAVAIALVLSACGSTPPTTNLLDQARSEYRMAQSNPAVSSYASNEMRLATEALASAEAASMDHQSAGKIDQLAYLARQKIAVTQEVAKQKAAEAEVANAAKERDQIRLDQRTNEANAAKENAEKAARAAQSAQNEASKAKNDTQDAKRKASELEAQLKALSAQKTDRGMVITLSDVLFDTDKAHLNAQGIRMAQKLSALLEQNPDRTVLVEGFTDSTGSTEHNQALSERRADAVRAALQDLGVSSKRIATRGYGEANPVSSNNTAQGRQRNRRVEIVLSDETGNVSAR